jgi:hypothetical protein
MMLIVALTIWLTLLAFFVVLCRGAAVADGRDFASTDGYPSGSSDAPRAAPRTNIAGLVLLEDRPAPVPRDLRVRAHGVRGHAGHYAAGS